MGESPVSTSICRGGPRAWYRAQPRTDGPRRRIGGSAQFARAAHADYPLPPLPFPRRICFLPSPSLLPLRPLSLVLAIHPPSFSPNTYHAPRVPAVVVYAESTEDVVKIVKIAKKYRIPITPWSGGTSLEGHVTAVSLCPPPSPRPVSTLTSWSLFCRRPQPYGGISVDLSRMDKIIKIHVEDSDVVVQAGVGWEDLNAHLKEEGIPLFFPLDPGPGACIGGMISTGCSGTNAVRYGTAKAEWILNATVVLPSGEVVKTRSRARKSSAGFDVTKLSVQHVRIRFQGHLC